MNRYRPSTPRFVLGAAAVAMMLSTLGLLVVAPSELEASADVFAMPAPGNASTAAAPARVTIECANVSAAHGPLAGASRT